MSTEIKELVSYLDIKFAAIDRQFDAVDKRFDAIDEKLTSHDDQLSAIRLELANVHDILETKADKAELRTMMSNLDDYANEAKRYFEEHIMLSAKVDRHEKWHEETAKKLGIKLR